MLRFVINLDRSPERLADVSAKLHALNVPFERIPAVYGRDLSDEEIAAITYPRNHWPTKLRFTRNLTHGEIGCFLSHRACWQRLVDSNEQWALVMEDDIEISSAAGPFLSSEEWIPKGVDLLQLSINQHEIQGKIFPPKIAGPGNRELVQPSYPTPLGTLGYIISRQAAASALALSEKLPAPVDNFMFSPWLQLAHIYPVWRISPALIRPNYDFDSDIGVQLPRKVTKAPFYIRHSPMHFMLDLGIKRHQRTGKPFTFRFE